MPLSFPAYVSGSLQVHLSNANVTLPLTSLCPVLLGTLELPVARDGEPGETAMGRVTESQVRLGGCCPVPVLMGTTVAMT